MSFSAGLPDDSVNVSETHPLRELALLLGGLVGLIAGLALAAALAVELLIPRLPPDLEVELFRGGWLPVVTGGDDDGETDEQTDAREIRVQRLVDRLAGHWPDNPYALRVALWEQEEVNAFALPGGRVVVTQGLLESVGSENELAFVVAHEIGHFHNRDHLRGLGRGLALAFVASAFAVGGAGAASDLALMTGAFAQRRFDRDQESDADAFGLGLVAAEYGHTAGASDFFAAGSADGEALGERLAGYLATHPHDEQRRAALERLAEERGWARRGPVLPW